MQVLPFHSPTVPQTQLWVSAVPWVRSLDTRAGRGNLDGKETFYLWKSHQAQFPELVTRAGAEGAEAAGRGGPQAKLIGEKP